ncbi:unnamed protein product [Linum trigynum]|uniref:Gnk2-homologous domain-containing protein n=1 Tax=Linum trigynum TaxID=586398 RepID=A0AAV2F4L9_9ROSI
MIHYSSSAADPTCPPPNAAPVCSPYNLSDAGTQERVSWQSVQYGGIGCLLPPIQYPGDNPDDDRKTTIYQYMSCQTTTDLKDPRCTDCIKGAYEFVAESCGSQVAGAQYATDDCCVRYETYPFCKKN